VSKNHEEHIFALILTCLYCPVNTVFLQCVCAPGWMGEFCQYGGDACLIKPNGCLNGATCITASQPSSPPVYACKCPLGFTGEITLLYYQLFCPFLSVCLSTRISQNMDWFIQIHTCGCFKVAVHKVMYSIKSARFLSWQNGHGKYWLIAVWQGSITLLRHRKVVKEMFFFTATLLFKTTPCYIK